MTEVRMNQNVKNKSLDKLETMTKESGDTVVATVINDKYNTEIVMKRVENTKPLIHFKDTKGKWLALVKDSSNEILQYDLETFDTMSLSKSKDGNAKIVYSFLISGEVDSETVLGFIQ